MPGNRILEDADETAHVARLTGQRNASAHPPESAINCMIRLPLPITEQRSKVRCAA
jgi:hypothetical protein